MAHSIRTGGAPIAFAPRYTWFVSALPLTLLLACGPTDQEPERYVVRDSMGIQIVESAIPLWGPLKEATRELALQELAEGFRIDFGQGMCTIAAAEMVDGRGFAPLVPWIQQVTLSPTGEAWVLRKEVGPNAQGPIDVFDPSGAYVGTLLQGTPFPLVFLDDDRFAAAETDELDITRLVVYTIGRERRTGGDGQAAG